MDAQILLIDAVMFGLCAALGRAARRQRASRLRIWGALARLASANGLRVQRAAASADGMPEAIGTLGERPVSVRGKTGGKYTPLGFVVTLTHRMPPSAPVWVGGAAAARLGLGLPGWTKRWVGEGPKENQALVAARLEASVDRFLARAGPGGVDVLVDWAHRPGFFVAGLNGSEFYLRFEEDAQRPLDLRALLGEMGGFVAALEAQEDPSKLARAPPALATRRRGATMDKVTSGMMVVLLLVGAIMILASGRAPDPDGLLLVGGMGAALMFIAAAMIWTQKMSAQERGILEGASPGAH